MSDDPPLDPLPAAGTHPAPNAQRHLAVLRVEIDRIASLARSVDHDAPLLHLPGWTAGDCLAHLVGDYEWAASIVEQRRADPSGIVAHPATGTALADAFDDAAHRLVHALGRSLDDLDEPCPNFSDGTHGRVAFWFRRQAHESTVHRWDLEAPTGRHETIEADVAADGVDEALHVYTRRYGGQRLDRPIVLGCDDVGASWLISPATIDGDGTRVTIDRITGEQSAPVDVSGSAEGLLLAVQHRLDPDAAELRFHHHEFVARTFLAGPLVA